MDYITKLYQLIAAENIWDKSIELSRNEYLKVGGSVDTNLYYVVSGSLKIFCINEYEEHIIRFGYKHNFIAALDSFISGQPSDFYIQALKKCSLKSISKAKFDALINSTTENRTLWNQILEVFVLQQIEREKDILTSSPLERYQRVFQRSPQLFQEIPNKYIASYLRMTPETLSRLKKS